VGAKEDEKALDERDQEREPEPPLPQPARRTALAVLDHLRLVHGGATLPDRRHDPGARRDAQPPGSALGVLEVVEEPVDHRAGPAYVCPEGATLE
jgi:hypothetical protein